jgi:CRISPR-associated RAMP protein (TIGR02581 family)
MSEDNRRELWDFTQFHNRLRVTGILHLRTALRIGTGRSTAAAEVDLPVIKDAAGRPYIPGSSFKGALRAYTEAVLRALDGGRKRDQQKEPALSCLSVSKPEKEVPFPEIGCLTMQTIQEWSRAYNDDPLKFLREELSYEIKKGEEPVPFDQVLLDHTCWACRVFGAPWLASRVLIRDLTVDEATWFGHYQLRDGVALDRDTETASEGKLYQFEAVPAGVRFQFELVADNLQPGEQGLLFLGLRAFERGQVPLGGARSRGLGAVELADVQVEETPSALALVKGDTESLDEAARQQRVRDFLDKVVGVSDV